MLPAFERADRIGEFWGYPESRAFAELLIDCEEDRTQRAVLVGMLREAKRYQSARQGDPDPHMSCFRPHLWEGAGCSRRCWPMSLEQPS